jgi:hypothetical protein
LVSLLVSGGLALTRLAAEHEDLEHYFLRLTGEAT